MSLASVMLKATPELYWVIKQDVCSSHEVTAQAYS